MLEKQVASFGILIGLQAIRNPSSRGKFSDKERINRFHFCPVAREPLHCRLIALDAKILFAELWATRSEAPVFHLLGSSGLSIFFLTRLRLRAFFVTAE
jgi:hypothetical protein